MRGKMERCHEGGFGRCGAVVLSLFYTSVSFPHFLQFVSGAAGAFLHSLSHLPSLRMCEFTARETAKTDDDLSSLN